MIWKAAQESKAMLSTGANPNEQRFTVLLQAIFKKGLLGKPYYMEHIDRFKKPVIRYNSFKELDTSWTAEI